MVAKFFERLLPLACVQRADDFFGYSGSIAFSILGPGGGEWTFTFADPEPVQKGFSAEADLRLWFTGAAFEAFVGGTLDAAEAVKAGEVRAEGEVDLLQDFGGLLMPPQRDLGWDVASD
ncbi:MAG: SCP2 sterol-binding domain-containing protein [Myxococcales bacterium]|nr:SCP2 sterol-binding domain-containing protein [Myxococcales bacterium]